MMDADLDIAIVGLACRFPGAQNPNEFWQNLAGGVESITRLSDEEILDSGTPKSHLTAPNYVKAAPVLDEPGAFDASFFGFTAGEARTMDPQHRILLELAHEAIEDAGCVPSDAPARVGVFTGAAMNTYFMHAGLNRNFAEDYIPTLIFNDKDFLSTRISYKLDLKGPSMTVQTACSTSLVAVHLARQSLLSEECDIALAGAISVRVPHRAGYFSDPGGISSPDGHVRAFDAEANGTVFGSGGGMIVMKRLRDALADGDTIRAIIKGSAINNDGAEKAGYTAPSVNSQADAIVEALANADVDAESISYIETHGSGTPVGDPIELRALTKAFRASTQRSGFCAIGSVKTNIGHLDAAAGMAGLIKTVLALQHRQIPASLNYSRPNPEINFAETPFFVNTRLSEWKSDGPRRAGIMATGMGGTNAHVVIEEAPASTSDAVPDEPSLLVLSAHTEAALADSAGRLHAFLESNPTLHLRDAAFTLQKGRRALRHRQFIVANDHAAALSLLAAKPARLTISETDGTERPLVLLLPGVGDHYVGMGRELYGAFPRFRTEVDRCAEILRPMLGRDIREILWPKDRDWKIASTSQGIDLKKMLAGNTQPANDTDSQRLNEITSLQPALFTIEYALAKLWIDLAGEPQAIVGHSMGEYVAACLSGVFSLEDALRLIVARTQLVASLPAAKMLAVTLPESELLPLLPNALSIALINGPTLCIVAGAPTDIVQFAGTLTERGITHRPVQNTHAFHSRMLDPIVGAFTEEIRKVKLSAPRIPFTSNVTGRWITPDEATTPEYWARHANHTARFDDALRMLWQMKAPILLEAGPGRTLGVLALQHPSRPSENAEPAIGSMRHHYESQRETEMLLAAAGRLWLCGRQIRWEYLHRSKPRRISLPTYPFQRQKYWIEPESLNTQSILRPDSAQLTDRGIDGWFYSPSWQRTHFPDFSSHDAGADGILWLIVSTRRDHAEAFEKCLASDQRAFRSVHLGDGFAQHENSSTEIDSAKRDDYVRLFRSIASDSYTSIRIIHLGCLAISRGASAGDQNLGFNSLIFIAQAVSEAGIAIPITMGIVSAAIQDVTGDEALNPEMATALGACGVIPKEFPNIRCFNVDLPNPGALVDPSLKIAQRILSEFAVLNPDEIVAYRGKHRWRRAFESITPPPPSIPRDNAGRSLPKRLRNRGVYLITGGTGGLGLAIARHLAKTCQAKIVLTRRATFPKKSDWRRLMTDGSTPAELLALIRELLEIEQLGADVEVVAANVSDPEQMRRALRETVLKFQSLNGVIHAAGIAHAGLIQASSPEKTAQVFSAKVQGTRVLHDILQDFEPDFLILFSSLASITAPFAHSDYCAANSFLDSFAAYSNSRAKYHTVAINWPVWKETGAVSKLETFMGIESWKDEALKDAILTKDALEVFDRILNSDLPQIIVSPKNLNDVLARPFPGASLSNEQTVASANVQNPSSQRSPLAAAELPNDETEIVIANIWSGIFGVGQIGIHERFTDLGGHSLMALQILTRIRSQCRVDITLRDFFEAPTIAQLSSVVRERMMQDLENLTDEEVLALIAKESQAHD